MRPAPRRPAGTFLFVCTNRRPAENPLGPGCAGHGEALFAELQRQVVARRLSSRLWLARTSCLGLCPRAGSAVTLSPGDELFTDASPSDAAWLIDRALR